MRHPRFLARGPHYLLIVALILIAAAAVALSLFSSAGAQAKGKIVLAWHAGFASRWLDPQEHDGTATPDNFFTALHDALIKNQGTAALRPSRPGRAVHVRRGREERHVHAAQGDQVPQRRPGHPAGRQVELRELPRAPRPTSSRRRPSASRSSTTARSVSSSRSPSSTSPILFGTANVAGPGWVVPEKYYQQVGPDGFKQKPDRRRPLQARPPRAGREGRDRGLRRLLPPGPREAARHGLGARGGHPGGHAGARRGGHHLQRPRRADRPRSGSFPKSRWRRCCPARAGSSSPASRTRRTRSTTSACARRSAWPSTGGPSTRPRRAGMGKVSGNWINDDVAVRASSGRSSSATSRRPSS